MKHTVFNSKLEAAAFFIKKARLKLESGRFSVADIEPELDKIETLLRDGFENAKDIEAKLKRMARREDLGFEFLKGGLE
jgi:hypothetical protein